MTDREHISAAIQRAANTLGVAAGHADTDAAYNILLEVAEVLAGLADDIRADTQPPQQAASAAATKEASGQSRQEGKAS